MRNSDQGIAEGGERGLPEGGHALPASPNELIVCCIGWGMVNEG
jgi:hypothetical protein